MWVNQSIFTNYRFIDCQILFNRHEKQLKVFFVGGPNQRKDFHIEEGEELFYMKKGSMELIVQEQGAFKTVAIQEGQVSEIISYVFYFPVNVYLYFL